MRRVQKNNAIKLYYKAHALDSGQSVTFTVWDDQGHVLVNNQAATAEVDANGLYYLDYTTPNQDLYLLVKSNLATGAYARPLVIMCGNPTAQKIFYVDDKFVPGKSLPYEVYDIDATTYLNSNLIDEGNGFYSADVTGLTDGTYFIKVDPYTSKFIMPLDFEYVPGECVATIEYRYIMVSVHTSKGGASKGRHSDYYGQMSGANRKIDAKLLYDDEADKLSGIAFIDKEEEGKNSKELINKVKAVLYNQDDDITEEFNIEAVLIND